LNRKFCAGLFALAATVPLSAQQSSGRLAQAKAALEAGQADQALRWLDSLPPSADAHNIRCRVLFSLEKWDAAAGECQQAVTMDSQDSEYRMWLGRALGERASRASMVSAFSLAAQVRTEFEESVRLDPQNAPALSDLGEFYYDAPEILGGGSDKAEAIAAQLERVDRARACELRGRIAEKLRDDLTAERELKRAITVSQHPAFQWMILGSFYTRHNRWTDMDAAVQSGFEAAQHDPFSNVALFNAASMLNRCSRNLSLAAKLFQQYLAGSPKTEEAPAFTAYTRLARIEAQLGNLSDAERERRAALELAHDYAPALQLKF
jgi:tetratricopeptide (TPR) repeat protein